MIRRPQRTRKYRQGQFVSIVKKKTIIIGCLLFAVCYLAGCDTKPEQKTPPKVEDYIKPIEGTSEIVPTDVARQGIV